MSDTQRSILIELDHNTVTSYVVHEKAPAYFGTHVSIARQIAAATGMPLGECAALESDLLEFINGNTAAGTKYYATTTEDAAIHFSYLYNDGAGKHAALALTRDGGSTISCGGTIRPAREMYRHADYDGLLN